MTIVAPCPPVDLGIEHVLVRQPATCIGQPLTCRPRLTDLGRECNPLVVVSDRDGDPIVDATGGVDPMWRHGAGGVAVAVRVALTSRWPCVDRVIEHRWTEQGRSSLGTRHIDPLALAGRVAVHQRRQDSDRHKIATMVVHVRVPPPGWRLIG